MVSSLSWIDFDSEAQQRAQRILTLFKERDTRDELGFGSIRDAISDTLFPGTSVLHAAPALHAVNSLIQGSAGFTRFAREVSTKAWSFLKKNAPDESGVIGGEVGDKLKTLPSAIYWAALG